MTPCPICRAPYGFHEEEVHAARPVIPAEKNLYPAWLTEQEAAPRCNCGALYTEPGRGPCRNPSHKR